MARLECPSCGSLDVDMEIRECRACKIGLPIGSYVWRNDVGFRASATSRRNNYGVGPINHSSLQDEPA